jgi:hypothetical protein
MIDSRYEASVKLKLTLIKKEDCLASFGTRTPRLPDDKPPTPDPSSESGITPNPPHTANSYPQTRSNRHTGPPDERERYPPATFDSVSTSQKTEDGLCCANVSFWRERLTILSAASAAPSPGSR